MSQVTAPPKINEALTPPEAKATQRSEYVVLQQSGPDDVWVELQIVRAASGPAAIRQAATVEKGIAGRFVAVPARSWKAVDVSIQTKSVVTLKEV